MYLSRILLDIRNRKTMLALASPNLFHGAIESSVPGERCRKLWRIDALNGNLYLLILCDKQADWGKVQSQFGNPEHAAETKDYTPLLERIADGSKWRFRLRANPTVARKTPGSDKRGKVLAHITTAHQMQWLSDQAKKNGFSLAPDEFTVTESKWYTFRKNNKQNVRLLAVTYEGILTITDAELFRKALVSGIGREKAYGMGMLTVTTAGALR